MTVIALIVAAGSGHRLGGAVPKQYRAIGGKPLLRHAVEALIGHPRIDAVRVVIAAGQERLASQALQGLQVGELIPGGDERAFSVINGLNALPSGTQQVLVHDAARPFCPPAVVDRLLDALQIHDAAVPVRPMADTLTKVSNTDTLDGWIDREKVFGVQTPQAFKLAALVRAYEDWRSTPPTDETAYFRAKRISVAAVEGDPMLDKLTTPADWARAEAMLAAQLVTRTGMGFDVHAFAGEGPVMLGGIAVPHGRGLAGHSDADVVLHALTDALLGAASLGDIGDHFPPSDPRWHGAASELFVTHALALVLERGGIIDHVDVTVICEMPKIGPHKAAMRSRIADILNLDERQVSIKATTTDGLGFTGRGEGIAAQAVASIRMEANHD